MRAKAAVAAIAFTAVLLALPASTAVAKPVSTDQVGTRQGIGSDLLCKFLESDTAAEVAVKLRDRISPRIGANGVISAVAGLAVVSCHIWAP